MRIVIISFLSICIFGCNNPMRRGPTVQQLHASQERAMEQLPYAKEEFRTCVWGQSARLNDPSSNAEIITNAIEPLCINEYRRVVELKADEGGYHSNARIQFIKEEMKNMHAVILEGVLKFRTQENMKDVPVPRNEAWF